MATAKAWYLIYSKPRQEQVALANLARQNYVTYLPMTTLKRRRRGQLIDVIEPLFPRYLFIHLDQGVDNWSPIRSTRGVAHLVRFGGVPAQVPDELIALLHEQENNEGQVALSSPTLQPGQNVRVMGGVLTGYEGVVINTSGEERATVLLSLANRYSKIKLDISDLDSV